MIDTKEYCGCCCLLYARSAKLKYNDDDNKTIDIFKSETFNRKRNDLSTKMDKTRAIKERKKEKLAEIITLNGFWAYFN